MPSINLNIKPNEVKREEFRKYLEHAGVMEALTNVLVALYEERLEYIRDFLTVDDFNKRQVAAEAEILKKQLAEAKSQIAEMKEKLQKYESENAA
ncbi:PREDICTED: C-Myc-binding protein-like [Ceratosolen solmsi marchali]|uniref:c-Myc-binding protein-like n=1 Tax=Ceratosolen solmsi marchali TaxID=326594 RepID=A0AAJ6VL82_9HYME|nr:PREDICTED: C-Myc-binding protein-like [Ceratosolen solmsi marchali]